MANFISLLSLAVLAIQAMAFPQYQSSGGLNERELEALLPRLNPVRSPPPPSPPKDTSVRLVNDKNHPRMPLRKGDIRGPCPGLNTLASHGYLPRNGIATPAQIVEAAQEGFSMDNNTAILITYASMLIDGNPVTNLMSIGGKSPLTGPDPPKPAIAGGLNTHAGFEGDASLTRADFFFGDNHSFNQTLFNEFVDFSNKFGGGVYNLTAAAEYRFHRIQESIATNPQFSLVAPRYFNAYGDPPVAPILFVDGRKADGRLNLEDALGFFRDMRMPDDFHRNDGSKTGEMLNNALSTIFAAHPVQPGANNGTVNSYTVDPTSATLNDRCKLYTNFVNVTVRNLYSNPTGILRENLNANLDFFFRSFEVEGCMQLFPYGH
ncbi:hypothetical protein M422DRAFT_160051 [Sphaerobolus stellatus SS14]|nr:hypothetical protein M422DRAFT_160051 [Sphaerobolus stellatus SS14]